MKAKNAQISRIEHMLAESEFNRFGLICVIIIVIGCLGGLAVGLGAIQYTATLIAVVIPTMMTLSLLVAVAPMRYIYYSALVSVIVDVSMIIYFSIQLSFH